MVKMYTKTNNNLVIVLGGFDDRVQHALYSQTIGGDSHFHGDHYYNIHYSPFTGDMSSGQWRGKAALHTLLGLSLNIS